MVSPENLYLRSLSNDFGWIELPTTMSTCKNSPIAQTNCGKNCDTQLETRFSPFATCWGTQHFSLSELTDWFDRNDQSTTSDINATHTNWWPSHKKYVVEVRTNYTHKNYQCKSSGYSPRYITPNYLKTLIPEHCRHVFVKSDYVKILLNNSDYLQSISQF